MVSSRFDNLWRLISMHNLEIDGNLSLGVICSICKKLMTDPHVGTCGCQFCGCCIKAYLGSEKRKCFGISEECKVEVLEMGTTVLPDYRTRLSLSKVSVRCPHLGCPVATELSKMEDHIRDCRLGTQTCPYEFLGCSNRISGGTSIDDHIQSNALHHSQLLFEANKSLKNDVVKLKEIVDINTKELEELRKEKHRHTREIDDVREQSKRKEALLTDQIVAAKRFMVECVDKVRADTFYAGEELKNKILGIKSDLEIELERREFIKESNVDIESRLKTNEDRIDVVRSDIYRTTSHLLAKYVLHDFIWTIHSFSILKGWQESDPFYKDGYKLSIGACIGSKHLYIYLKTLKGDVYDNWRWPMTHTVTLTIVNQLSMTPHKCETYKFGANSSENNALTAPPSLFGRPPESTVFTPRNDDVLTEPPNLFGRPPDQTLFTPRNDDVFTCTDKGTIYTPSRSHTPLFSESLKQHPSTYVNPNYGPKLLKPNMTKDYGQTSFTAHNDKTSPKLLFGPAKSFISKNNFCQTQNTEFVANRTNYSTWCLWISMKDIEKIPGLLLNDSVIVCCHLFK